MKIDGRRSNLITIEPSDNPQTVVAALREGAQWAARNLSRDDAGHWRHNAANAWETIEDGYGIYIDWTALALRLVRISTLIATISRSQCPRRALLLASFWYR